MSRRAGGGEQGTNNCEARINPLGGGGEVGLSEREREKIKLILVEWVSIS